MRLRELTLVNFRNYVRLALAPGERITVLRGNNGQGKSNVLEAIYFLATTRSPRAGSDRELVHWRARRDTIPFARLEARIAKEDLDVHVEILIRAETEPTPNGASPANGTVPSIAPVAKQIKLNGLPTRAVELVGQVNVVLFTPEDVALVAGPPVGRRRYLDITSSQVSGIYLRTLSRYNRIVAQRNQLLRQVRERRQSRDTLGFWSDELIEAGSLVVARRLEMIAAVNRELGPLYRQLSGDQQTLQLVYQPTSHRPDQVASIGSLAIEAGAESNATGAAEQARIAELYAARIRDLVSREIEQGVSLVGPHRDDFAFLLDEVDLNTYGSRGQQRLAVLALKLAEGEYMRAQTEERPIILLDDVLSELDPARRGFVLEQAGRQGQTFITATDLADFPAELLAAATVYRVEHGTLIPETPGATEDRENGRQSAEDANIYRAVPAPLRRVAE